MIVLQYSNIVSTCWNFKTRQIEYWAHLHSGLALMLTLQHQDIIFEYCTYIHASPVLIWLLFKINDSTWPAVTWPGHQTIVGSLEPPSKVVSFPHRNGPLEPPWHADSATHYIIVIIIIIKNTYIALIIVNHSLCAKKSVPIIEQYSFQQFSKSWQW